MLDTTDLEREALAIDAAFQRDMSTLAKRTDLSQQGKAQEAAQLDAKRRGQVAALQAQGQARLDTAKMQAQRDAQAQRTAEIDAKRQLLGDVVLADVYRRRLARLDGDGIAQMFQNAVDGWEREIVRSYGLLALEERTEAPGATRQDFSALAELQQTAQAAQDADLKAAELRLSQLDLAAYRQGMADRLNVMADMVPSPF